MTLIAGAIAKEPFTVTRALAQLLPHGRFCSVVKGIFTTSFVGEALMTSAFFQSVESLDEVPQELSPLNQTKFSVFVVLNPLPFIVTSPPQITYEGATVLILTLPP